MFNLAKIQRADIQDTSTIKRLMVGDVFRLSLFVPPYNEDFYNTLGNPNWTIFEAKGNQYYTRICVGGGDFHCYCRVRHVSSSPEAFINIINSYKRQSPKGNLTLTNAMYNQFNIMFSDVYYDYNGAGFDTAVNYILNTVKWSTWNDDGARAFALLNSLNMYIESASNEFAIEGNGINLRPNFLLVINDLRLRMKDISLKAEDDKKYPNKQADIILE